MKIGYSTSKIIFVTSPLINSEKWEILISKNGVWIKYSDGFAIITKLIEKDIDKLREWNELTDNDCVKICHGWIDTQILNG